METDRMSYCRLCRERWAQAFGLCRRCKRATGTSRATIHVAATPSGGTRIERLPSPATFGTIIDRGIAFEIVWNGSVR